MQITNREIIANLNRIGAFVEAEKKIEKALLSATGELAIAQNRKKLMAAYETFDEVRKNIGDNEQELNELLNAEVEVADYTKISANDFRDGITSELIIALDFMTE